MNKVICKKLELVHVQDIDKMYADQVTLKSGKTFTQLILEGKAEYSSQSQTPDAGPVVNETVTAKIRPTQESYIIRFPLKYYVIRLYTDAGAFIVGSLDYPAELTFKDDKVYVNLTFKASRPL